MSDRPPSNPARPAFAPWRSADAKRGGHEVVAAGRVVWSIGCAGPLLEHDGPGKPPKRKFCGQKPEPVMGECIDIRTGEESTVQVGFAALCWGCANAEREHQDRARGERMRAGGQSGGSARSAVERR